MTLEDNWSIQEMPPPRREFAGRLFFMNQEIPILVVVDDLIFASMILETARRLGVAVEAVKIEDLGARVRQGPVRSVIIDLNHRSGAAIEAVRALKAESSWRGIVCGFVRAPPSATRSLRARRSLETFLGSSRGSPAGAASVRRSRNSPRGKLRALCSRGAFGYNSEARSNTGHEFAPEEHEPQLILRSRGSLH